MCVRSPRTFCFDQDTEITAPRSLKTCLRLSHWNLHKTSSWSGSTGWVYEFEGLREPCGTEQICSSARFIATCCGLARIEATRPHAAAKDNHKPGIARLPVRWIK